MKLSHKRGKGSVFFLVVLLCNLQLFAVGVYGLEATPQQEGATPAQAQEKQSPGQSAVATSPSDSGDIPGVELPNVAGQSPPDQQAIVSRERVRLALLRKEFSYSPEMMVDPFVPFIVQQAGPSEAPLPPDDDREPPEPHMPLTPLEKMAAGQIERGFKAVLWGEMGRRAVIEDDAGKGYIVSIGTAIGKNRGVIADILIDRLVIQQQVWDPALKQMVMQNVEVKLTKAGDKDKPQ